MEGVSGLDSRKFQRGREIERERQRQRKKTKRKREEGKKREGTKIYLIINNHN